MKNKYIDLIDQTYYFPQEEFTLDDNKLLFHNIDLMQLVEEYGAPLKFTYLPQISNNINKAKSWFKKPLKNTITVVSTIIAIALKVHILSMYLPRH